MCLGAYLGICWPRVCLAGTTGSMLLERWTISYSPSSFSGGGTGSSSNSRPAMDNNSIYKRLVGWLHPPSIGFSNSSTSSSNNNKSNSKSNDGDTSSAELTC